MNPDRNRRILDAIDHWHEAHAIGQPLHDYLGWTEDEYASWVQTNVPPIEREGAE